MNETEYDKLVAALRCCASGACDSEKCDYMGMGSYGCMIGLAQDAADAIEALNRLVDLNTERCECLREQLRKAQEQYEKHLNELEQQLPKQGKFVRVEDGESYHYECSECGERPLYSRYGDVVFSGVCPMCGTKMEVQE